MTQFASTLYPQTNPTNQVLLDFRRDTFATASARRQVDTWLSFLCSPYSGERYRRDHADHALRVLTRLAALSG